MKSFGSLIHIRCHLRNSTLTIAVSSFLTSALAVGHAARMLARWRKSAPASARPRGHIYAVDSRRKASTLSNGDEFGIPSCPVENSGRRFTQHKILENVATSLPKIISIVYSISCSNLEPIVTWSILRSNPDHDGYFPDGTFGYPTL